MTRQEKLSKNVDGHIDRVASMVSRSKHNKQMPQNIRGFVKELAETDI